MEHIPENIKFLILKRQNGLLTDREKTILDNWYNEELPDELYWYGDTEAELKSRIETNVKFRIALEESTGSAVGRSFLPKALVASIAAFFLLCFAIWFYIWKGQGDLIEPISILSKNKEITKVILPDQTIVWLKGNGRLNYPSHFSGNTREVELEGEALFEVAKDKTRPFIIHAGDYTTRVVGTSFNLKVRPDEGKFDLDVLTGKVEVTRKRLGLTLESKYTIAANESLHTTNSNYETPAKVISNINKEILVLGTQYDMNFVSAPLEDIMKRFEQKFDVRFTGYTGEYSACKVTANLTDQSLETSLKIISMSINADYKINNREIRLTGGGCF